MPDPNEQTGLPLVPRDGAGGEPAAAPAGSDGPASPAGSAGPTGPVSPAGAAGPEPTFSQAMTELEAILARIEREETDIDRLAGELQRAAQLLDICRGKIRRAEVEVTQIVQKIETEGGDGRTGG
jgi:exodeoxyribonuclease VII small subunit